MLTREPQPTAFLRSLSKSATDFPYRITACDESTCLEPTNAICWALRGEAKVAIGDKSGAKLDLDQAVTLDGGDEYFRTLRDTALAQHHV